ncbi:MAG: hypothetical protein M1829_006497 [Trizodia sp. TS-e1964]|nr:MAG: hypothetical protein M1829_006497 [Trizodia sp. TS-e1964]
MVQSRPVETFYFLLFRAEILWFPWLTWRFADKQAPALSYQTAAVITILYTLSYVLPFYIFASTRPSPHLSRDAPSCIQARIRAVTLSSAVCSAATYLLMVRKGLASPWEALHWLGWWPVGLREISQAMLLTATLFLGPIFEKGVVEGGWRAWLRGGGVGETLGSWIGWRNFVAGPFTEEVVFRSAVVPLHLLCLMSPLWIVFTTPLYFGIAHIHHLYEYTLTHPHTPFLPALLRSVFQFGFTTVFGFYATFIFLRTGSLPAAVLAHAFCNWCQLPRLWGRVGTVVAMPPPRTELSDKKDHELTPARPGIWEGEQESDLGVWWSVSYYFLLVAGVVLFSRNLWTLTQSEMQLVAF